MRKKGCDESEDGWKMDKNMTKLNLGQKKDQNVRTLKKFQT